MKEFSKETDGFFARHFDRHISGWISRQLIATPITPNQITIGVTLLGIVAGVFLASASWGTRVAGAFLFLLTSILDGCDGEVARAKGLSSRLGAWLDFWGDNVVHVAVFWGIAVGVFRESGDPLALFLGRAAVAGTLLSATLAAWQTQRRAQSSFTSVTGDIRTVSSLTPWRRILARASDALARRDFVYAVPVLAMAGLLSYFLWAVAIGVNVYAFVLILLSLSTTRSA